MALDGIVMGAITKQLQKELINRKIDRIYQVKNREIVIHFRREKLFISASANNPRIYMAKKNFDNPKTPPLFSMVMRKHLSGAIVKDIYQYGSDRVIRIDVDGWDDFSQVVQKSLIIEIMGRHSNIILTHKDDTIIDAITRVNHEMSRVRQILPNLKYKYLPDESKENLMDMKPDDIYKMLYSIDSNRSVENTIFDNLEGFSRPLGTEIATRAGVDPSLPYSQLTGNNYKDIKTELLNLKNTISSEDYRPTAYYDGDKLVDYHVVKLTSLNNLDQISYSDISTMLEEIYTRISDRDRLNQAAGELRRSIKRKLDRDINKLSNQKQELIEAEDRDKYRVWADLLSANFHKITPGEESITVNNFYSETNEPITIPIDPKYTGPINAQRYYKKYQSLKNAQVFLTDQIKSTKAEVDYLSSVLSTIDLADTAEEISEIKNELIAEGYIKRNKRTQKKASEIKAEFIEYNKYGYTYLVGRNNRQNDLLTFKEANRHDLWLHAQGVPGSHVIIKNQGKDIPGDVIEYGARLAAYYSSSRDSGSIDVDYTEKLNVRRHPANKPGLVNYTNFDTIHVDSSKIE